MKLISTLQYAAERSTPAGTGNYGGDLRLFFTTMNPADSRQVAPGQIEWQGSGANDTYNLPSGDVIILNLNLITTPPGVLRIFGTMSVTTGGITYTPQVGAGGQSFVPGTPCLAILSTRFRNVFQGKQFEFGFELAMPWDGVMADCYGRWWTTWAPAPAAPAPPGGLHTNPA